MANISKLIQFDIIEDYISGYGINRISKKYSISQNKVYQILRTNNIKIRQKGSQKRILSKNQIESIVTMYIEGKPLKDIEKEFRTSKERIKELLRENGVKVDKRNSYNYVEIKKGEKFNHLEFIEELDERKCNKIMCKVKCDCNNIKNVFKADLLNGKVKSCGCIRDGLNKKEDRFEVVSRTLYSEYRKSARVRGYSFSIEFDLFKKLITSEKCYYCGSKELKQRKDESSDYLLSYIGIDRLKNNLGYESDNVVPCCTTCNYMKRNMDDDEFLSIIERIYNNRVVRK